ncbi:MAG: hypothetical protein U0736_23085 [Gemmataceae bacterium]
MRTGSLLIAGVLAVVSGAVADRPTRPIEEWHETAHLDGVRVGSLSTSIVRDDTTGQLRATSTLSLTLRRYGSTATVRREVSTTETADGQVLAVAMRQGAPGGRQLVLDGTVRDGVLQVKIDGGRIERRLRWPAGGLGLVAQEHLFAARKVQPGDRFEFQRFDPTYNAVLNIRVVVTEPESIDVGGSRRSLLRAELTPDRLETATATVQPAKTIVWLDDQSVIVRRQTELEGLGTLVLTRASREQAAVPVTASVDVGARSLVPLDRAISSPYATRSVLYRFTVRGEDDPARLLVSDEHQEVSNVRGNRFDLLVHPVRPAARRRRRRSTAGRVPGRVPVHRPRGRPGPRAGPPSGRDRNRPVAAGGAHRGLRPDGAADRQPGRAGPGERGGPHSARRLPTPRAADGGAVPGSWGWLADGNRATLCPAWRTPPRLSHVDRGLC